jgi:hypothetical protein
MIDSSRDTRDSAVLVQLAAYRAMGGAARYCLGVEMSDYARDVALQGLRSRNPDASERELAQLYHEKVLGWRLPTR